jgi:hypothetical protein
MWRWSERYWVAWGGRWTLEMRIAGAHVVIAVPVGIGSRAKVILPEISIGLRQSVRPSLKGRNVGSSAFGRVASGELVALDHFLPGEGGSLGTVPDHGD